MEYDGSEMNFEGIHFLAAFDSGGIDTDDEAASWNSSLSNDDDKDDDDDDDDDEEIDVKPSAAKKRCPLDVRWNRNETPKLNPFPFTGDSGLKFGLIDPEPIDVFNCLFKPEFLEGILVGTNRYARDLKGVDTSNFGPWKPLTIGELQVFLGLLFHTGTIRMNNLSDYWSYKRLFDIKVFRNGLTMNRFARILTAIRFDKSAVSRDEDGKKINVLSSLVGYFNTVMESVCYPGRELVVDECLAVTNNGIQHCSTVNPVFDKRLLSLHSLCEPYGLIHKIVVTEGDTKKSTVVNLLTSGKTGRGHSVFLDSSYCDVNIVQELLYERTYCTGILNNRAKCVPNEMKKVKLVKGGPPVMLYTEPGICLIKWRCREEVYAVSSEFRDNDTTTNRTPLLIRECRKSAINFDRKELLSAYKPLEGKNLGWYRSIGIHFLQTLFRNAFLLYSNNVRKIAYHDFRLLIIDNLLKKEMPAPETTTVSSSSKIDSRPPNSSLVDDDLDELHVPRKFPKRPGQRSLRKRCRVCLKSGKRTDSYYHCPVCFNQPALCLEKCFAEYHSALKNKVVDKTPSSEDGSDGSVE